ncbi:MAG: FAD-dependent oxidoreductase [Burkholderiales bacterium]|nr:FAD-dependent oxidoreductase [Burkholderiales bacterium]
MNAGRTAWTVLDTAFGDGSKLLACWQQWKDTPQRPTLLHYVGMLAEVPSQRDWPPALQTACQSLGKGFSRILLDGGRVSVTLCIGPLQTMLAEQSMQADTVLLGHGTGDWDKWTLKALARLCRRGTRVVTQDGAQVLQNALEEAGFRPAPPDYIFDPRWDPIGTRKGEAPTAIQSPARCAVIGAGLAGASVAHALALRGWQLTVLDRHARPALGASGLPVGLVVPHVSADDSPRSRMSRSGTRLMLGHARHLLAEGPDWAPSGVLEHLDAEAGKLWHPMAGWIKPALLVQAWLDHPRIRFVAGAQVTGLRRQDGVWHLFNENGQELAVAEHVVLANAFGSQSLLNSIAGVADLQSDVLAKAAALQQVHGTLSHGLCPATPSGAATPPHWPEFPVNGNGSFIPCIPSASGLRWYAGSTFELQDAATADVPAQHQANLQKLHALLPKVGMELASAFMAGTVTSWQGTRCVTHDRLPLVGALQNTADNSLWICAGMGARGLSFSALCAELAVAQLHGEPLPVEASLARGLSARRPRRKRPVNQTF